MAAGAARWVVVVALCLSVAVAGSHAWIADDFNVWNSEFVSFWPDGEGLTLTLAEGHSASGVGTKTSYLFGSFGAWIKLPAANAAGTVATLYLSSPFPQQCEFDFEFLGNVAGAPRKIHSNVFVDGQGGREEQIFFPDGIDPTSDYHYYSFEWHSDAVTFFVDWKPIRQFRNLRKDVSNGTYCDHKAMALYLSIWDGSSWATDGGAVKLDWNAAPFRYSATNFQLDACPVYSGADVAPCQNAATAAPQPLTPDQVTYLQNLRNNASIVHYSYCTDTARYPDINTAHPECNYNIL